MTGENTFIKKMKKSNNLDQANKVLRQNKIKLKSLPGYGNSEMKKKDMESVMNEKCSIKISD